MQFEQFCATLPPEQEAALRAGMELNYRQAEHIIECRHYRCTCGLREVEAEYRDLSAKCHPRSVRSSEAPPRTARAFANVEQERSRLRLELLRRL
jgi:hypothetical protein